MNSSALESRDHDLEITTLQEGHPGYRNFHPNNLLFLSFGIVEKEYIGILFGDGIGPDLERLRKKWPLKQKQKAVVTTLSRLRFDRRSTHIRLQFDRATTILRYGHLFWAAALRAKQINVSTRLCLAGYVTVSLMTFDKQSNSRRMAVKSKSSRSVTVVLWALSPHALS